VQEKDVKRIKERKESKKGRKEKKTLKKEKKSCGMLQTEVNEKRYCRWRDERLCLGRKKDRYSYFECMF